MKTIAIAVGALLVVGIGVAVISRLQGVDPRTSSPPRDMRQEAVSACQQFITKQLRAPATVQFESNAEAKVRMLVDDSEGTYTVFMFIDAKNIFDAPVRTNYECLVKPAAGTDWSLVNLKTVKR